MSIATMVRRTTTWCLATTPPAEWAEYVATFRGGVFHTPVALRLSIPDGIPIYATYLVNDEVQGIALGVRTRCRLSGRAQHAYFPTWPAFAPGVTARTALGRLHTTLGAAQIAEVRWDSFDAGSVGPEATVPTRNEYVVDLAAVDDAFEWPPSGRHRRSLRRGERDGWQLQAMEGTAAVRALSGVMERVVERVTARGSALEVNLPSAVRDPSSETAPWAATTYAAIGEEGLLAAVLIGRGGQRAFYIMGGATSDGYHCGASAWLHARLAVKFAADGLTTYNLGGAPVGAVHEGDLSHGLHTFKVGFGARVVGCAGDRWIIRRTHDQGHRLLRWASGWTR